MTKPYDLYLRFLITKGCASVDDVNEYLDDLSLPYITKKEFEDQHNLVHNAVPRPISDQIADQAFHGDFIKWMKFLGVVDFWYFEKPFRHESHRYIKLVHDIHQDVLMRATINALLIKGAMRKDICADINAKFSYMLKESHVEMYDKFYWNVRRMTRKGWKAYIRLTKEFDTASLFSALTDDLEVMRMKLELSSKANISGTLQFFFTQSSQRAKEYLRLRSPENDKEARSWMKISMDLADKYAKHRTGDVEDFGKTLQLEFDYVENNFATPDDALFQEREDKDKANKARKDEGKDE